MTPCKNRLIWGERMLCTHVGAYSEEQTEHGMKKGVLFAETTPQYCSTCNDTNMDPLVFVDGVFGHA